MKKQPSDTIAGAQEDEDKPARPRFLANRRGNYYIFRNPITHSGG